jgi:DNA-binding CsgD family transcriptional regulator
MPNSMPNPSSRSQQSNEAHPTIAELQKISQTYSDPTRSFEDIYADTIRPIAENPCFFNSFHWTTNIREQKLMRVTNIKRILGYDEDQFDFRKSLEIIHPNYQRFVQEYGLMAYRMLNETKYHPLSPYAHYCIQYPMRAEKGDYILVQMNASVIQTDEKGNAIANYNRFEVLGPYLEVPFVIRPRVYFRDTAFGKERAAEAERDITRRVSKIMLDELGITPKELEVLKGFADKQKAHEIADVMKVGRETIKTHSDNIRVKVRQKLCGSFGRINDIAFYLRKIEII